MDFKISSNRQLKIPSNCGIKVLVIIALFEINIFI